MTTQPISTPHNQEYGVAKAQAEAQRIQPIAGRPEGPKPSGGPPTNTPLPGLGPGEVPTLTDPTARPDEPLTAGLPVGAGPGPSSLTTASFGPMELSVLRGIYLQYPNEDLRRMIEWTEQNLA